MSNVQEEQVQGVFGRCRFERHTDAAGAVSTLWVPFQAATFEVKDEIKQLGFRCIYDEKVWTAAYSQEREQKLRALLAHGDLPAKPAARQAPAAAAAAAAAAAGAAAAGAPAAVPTPEQSRVRRREEEPQEEAFVGGAVLLRRLEDGYVELQGAPLRHISPMLQRILRFQQQPAAAAPAGAQQPPPPPRWRSSFALSERELEFVRDVLQHRRQKMEEGRAFDDKKPLPSGCTLPLRFKPRTPGGQEMRGPYTSKKGMEHNYGRQFFSTFRDGWGEFLWADGTDSESAEAFERNAAWAEAEGIVPPGMGRAAQQVAGMQAFLQGMLEGGGFVGGWAEAGAYPEDWDEEVWGEENEEEEEWEEEEDEDEDEEEDDEEEEDEEEEEGGGEGGEE